MFKKFGWVIYGSVLALVVAVATTQARAEGGNSSGGGDRVEVLFIEAQKSATAIVEKIDYYRIDRLNVSAATRSWLKSSNSDRLNKLQFYVSSMELVFQEGPCVTEGVERGACFDSSDPMHPRMIVSRKRNRRTSESQAVALVLHEAGHFTGEMDHLLLSRVGSDLAGGMEPENQHCGFSGSIAKRIQDCGNVSRRTRLGNTFSLVLRYWKTNDANSKPKFEVWRDDSTGILVSNQMLSVHTIAEAVVECAKLEEMLRMDVTWMVPQNNDWIRLDRNRVREVLPTLAGSYWISGVYAAGQTGYYRYDGDTGQINKSNWVNNPDYTLIYATPLRCIAESY